MDQIFNTLRSKKYQIRDLIINNFTTKHKEVSIDIHINTVDDGNKKLHFSKVKNINMDGGYSSSDYSSLIISETTDFLLPVAKYHISIGDDVITFYSDKVEIESIIDIEDCKKYNLRENLKLNYIDEIFKFLNGKYCINRLKFNNFTTSSEDDEISIDIDIWNQEYGNKKIHFSPAREIIVDMKAYETSHYSTILITDITELQWVEVRYKVSILKDVMSFYCREIEME